MKTLTFYLARRLDREFYTPLCAQIQVPAAPLGVKEAHLAGPAEELGHSARAQAAARRQPSVLFEIDWGGGSTTFAPRTAIILPEAEFQT